MHYSLVINAHLRTIPVGQFVEMHRFGEDGAVAGRGTAAQICETIRLIFIEFFLMLYDIR